MSANSTKLFPRKSPQYVLITGRGRSGTTWLGQILNTYQNCIYKYEPFLPSKSSPFQEWKDKLDSNYNIEELRSWFWSLCCSCYIGIDNPPFFDKSFRRQASSLLYLFYGLGKRINKLKYLYEWYGRPQLNKDVAVLMKDVNFPTNLLPHLCTVIQPHLISVVRNPYANIASYLKGIELGLFSSDRDESINHLKNLLSTPEGRYLNSYISQLEDMSIAQFEALRWRFQVESLVEYTNNYQDSMIVVYENFCMNPLANTKEIFDFLGWQIERATEDFIRTSTSNTLVNSAFSKSYYSVYRDPQESMSKWKTQLTETQKSDIELIVKKSPIKDLWSNSFKL